MYMYNVIYFLLKINQISMLNGEFTTINGNQGIFRYDFFIGPTNHPLLYSCIHLWKLRVH